MTDEDAKIILIRNPAGPGLQAAEPAFRTQMLEEGDEPIAKHMLPAFGRQGAGNIVRPGVIIGETRVAPDLLQKACALPLEGDDGGTVDDGILICSILSYRAYKHDDMIKQSLTRM